MTALVVIGLLGVQVGAADTLRLADAFYAARTHFPPARQTELYSEITDRRIENISARLRPQFSASAQAVYQSDVPELPIEMPGFTLPDIRKDQYKAAVSIEQLIYDGGAASVQRELEQTAGALPVQEVDVSLHERLDRVSDAYFAALLQDAGAATLELHRASLISRRSAVEAQIEEGLLSASEADKLTVEILKIEQQIAEARENRTAAIHVLAELSGADIGSRDVLALPDLTEEIGSALLAASTASERPEIRVFELQKERLERQEQLAALKNRPKIIGFGTAAYGRPPGLNMFENELSPFFSVGIQMHWPIWDWGSARREQEIAALQRQVVETQEEAFAEGIRAAAVQARAEIDRLRVAVERDREIIQLRNQIAARAAEQLENGTISATDYILEERAARQAQLELHRRRIELGLAEVRYLGILGHYDEIR